MHCTYVHATVHAFKGQLKVPHTRRLHDGWSWANHGERAAFRWDGFAFSQLALSMELLGRKIQGNRYLALNLVV